MTADEASDLRHLLKQAHDENAVLRDRVAVLLERVADLEDTRAALYKQIRGTK